MLYSSAGGGWVFFIFIFFFFFCINNNNNTTSQGLSSFYFGNTNPDHLCPLVSLPPHLFTPTLSSHTTSSRFSFTCWSQQLPNNNSSNNNNKKEQLEPVHSKHPFRCCKKPISYCHMISSTIIASGNQKRFSLSLGIISLETFWSRQKFLEMWEHLAGGFGIIPLELTSVLFSHVLHDGGNGDDDDDGCCYCSQEEAWRSQSGMDYQSLSTMKNWQQHPLLLLLPQYSWTISEHLWY